MNNLTVQRFQKGHPLFSDIIVTNTDPLKGLIGSFQCVFGQCIDTDTKQFIDYTLERRDTLLAEGIYEFAYYNSPANHANVILLTKDFNGHDISLRKLEHHIANWPYELKGCTAHGTGIDIKSGELLHSRTAITNIMTKLNGQVGKITYEILKHV